MADKHEVLRSNLGPGRHGAEALQKLVQVRDAIDRPDPGSVRAWKAYSSDIAWTVMRKGSPLSYRQRRWLAFFMAGRTAAEYEHRHDRSTLRDAMLWLANGYLMIANDRNLSFEQNQVGADAVLEIGRRSKLPAYYRDVAGSKFDGGCAESTVWMNTIGLSRAEFIALLSKAQQSLSSPDISLSIPLNVDRQDNSAAVLLTKMPVQSEQPGEILYDRSDADVRVTNITLEAFRGSPKHLSVDFSKGGRPLSAILFGDNGSGKSTIVDAIEFGLQARVGRSTSYDSPLAPSLRSYARTDEINPTVSVRLSDGTMVVRSLSKMG
jgi:hypothetical protein